MTADAPRAALPCQRRWRPRRGSVALVVLALSACGGDPAPGGAGHLVAPRDGEPFRHIVLEGSPYALGLHQGRLLRDQIRARVELPIAPAVADVVATYAGPMRDLLPPAALDELAGIAAGAGVSADALFLREIERDVVRWHETAAPVARAAWASGPGPAPCVAVQYARLELATRAEPLPAVAAAAPPTTPRLLLVERHPAGGVATLLLAAPGSLGGVAGVSGRGVVAVTVEDATRRPEQRSLRGPPSPAGLRFALERGADADAVVAALPRTIGQRVLVADAENRRVEAVVALSGEDPVHSPPTAWVLTAAGGGGEAAENAAAQERRLGAYGTRPDCEDAPDLARAGLGGSGGGPPLAWSRDGVEAAWPIVVFVYRWARER